MLDVHAILPERLRPLSRAEYDRMVEMGLFADERVELLHGFIVTMSPQGTRHASVIRRLNRLLVTRLGERAMVQCQLPLAVSDDSEPEPDFAVVANADYVDDHPRTALLVIEVAGSSLRIDRGLKAGLYAAAGVPEYWIVDVAERVIEVRTEPADGAYRAAARRAPGEEIALAAFPDVLLAVSEIV